MPKVLPYKSLKEGRWTYSQFADSVLCADIKVSGPNEEDMRNLIKEHSSRNFKIFVNFKEDMSKTRHSWNIEFYMKSPGLTFKEKIKVFQERIRDFFFY